MAEKQYLYGASVQGIQKFIFQTNELKDIIGASELVQRVCNDFFMELFNEEKILFKEGNLIVHAAGNIKYLFESEDDLKKIFLKFPKKVITNAPGITISQAFVDMEDPKIEEKVNHLENLLKVQRNKPMNSITTGLMGIQRSRTTGLPAVVINKKGEYLDEASKIKKELASDIQNSKKENSLSKKTFGSKVEKGKYPYDIKDLTTKNDWIAVVHIDGNGLGNIVSTFGDDLGKMKNFSEELDECTKTAAQNAFSKLFEREKFEKVVPLRPVVIAGDDFTFIIRGDLAVEFVRDYLDEFVNLTNKNLTPIIGKGLTACAGIAFIKSSYPFYYGYNLAEELCSKAKKITREKSSLMFHKVQDSFIEDWSDIAKRELQPKTEENTSFEFGPYFLDKPEDTYWTISQLVTAMNDINDESKVIQSLKTHLRNWLSIVHESGIDKARENENRMIMLFNKKDEDVVGKYIIKKHRKDSNGGDWKVYPTYDILSLSSVTYQQTKDTENNE